MTDFFTILIVSFPIVKVFVEVCVAVFNQPVDSSSVNFDLTFDENLKSLKLAFSFMLSIMKKENKSLMYAFISSLLGDSDVMNVKASASLFPVFKVIVPVPA